MNVADAIVKLGFRRWYERQLIEGHAYLVTCVLCMITVAATMESFLGNGAIGDQLAMAVGAFAAGAIAWYAWARYRAIMSRAEWLGENATCGACRTYARFRVVGTAPRPLPERGDVEVLPFPPAEASLLSVECRLCGHCWTI